MANSARGLLNWGKKKKKNEGKGNRGKNACCSEPKHNQVFVKNKTESEDVDMLKRVFTNRPPHRSSARVPGVPGGTVLHYTILFVLSACVYTLCICFICGFPARFCILPIISGLCWVVGVFVSFLVCRFCLVFVFMLSLELSLCVCVCFLPIHSGHQVRWISHPPSFCGACLNFSREKDSAIPFPRRP